jgi:hypothetical protein
LSTYSVDGDVTRSSSVSREAGRVIKARDVLRSYLPANPRGPSDLFCRSEDDRRVFSANPRGRSDLFCQSQDNRRAFSANPRATVGSFPPIGGQPSGFPGQSAGDRRIFSVNQRTTVGLSRPIHVGGRIFSANRIGPSGFTGQSRLPGIVPSKPSSERPSDHPTAVLRQTITRGKHSVYTMRLLPAFQGSIVVKGGVDGRPVHSGSTY